MKAPSVFLISNCVLAKYVEWRKIQIWDIDMPPRNIFQYT